jgi:hypothetical protein
LGKIRLISNLCINLVVFDERGLDFVEMVPGAETLGIIGVTRVVTPLNLDGRDHD